MASGISHRSTSASIIDVPSLRKGRARPEDGVSLLVLLTRGKVRAMLAVAQRVHVDFRSPSSRPVHMRIRALAFLTSVTLLGSGCAAGTAGRGMASPGVRAVATNRAPAVIGPYSQAVIANGTLYASGQSGVDPATGQLVAGDAIVQAERALGNLAAVLEASGASWSNVVKTTVYVTDIRDFARINEAYGRILGSARPARSTVQVAALPRGALVAIDLVAVLP